MADWDTFWSGGLPADRNHHLVRRLYESEIVRACMKAGMARHAALSIAYQASDYYKAHFERSQPHDSHCP